MGFVQHVTIRAKPGKASEILKILANIRAEVDQKEPGTKQYHPAQNPEDENDIFIWEEYDSEEALQFHRKGTAYAVWAKERESLTDGVTLKRLSPL